MECKIKKIFQLWQKKSTIHHGYHIQIIVSSKRRRCSQMCVYIYI